MMKMKIRLVVETRYRQILGLGCGKWIDVDVVEDPIEFAQRMAESLDPAFPIALNAAKARDPAAGQHRD